MVHDAEAILCALPLLSFYGNINVGMFGPALCICFAKGLLILLVHARRDTDDDSEEGEHKCVALDHLV